MADGRPASGGAQQPGGQPGGLLAGMIDHYAGSPVAHGLDSGLKGRLREGLLRGGGEFFCRDMEALWKMLEMVIVHSGVDPRAGRETVNLLNLACGACEEGSVLSAFCGQGCREVRQFALDMRAREIAEGKRRYQATERLFEEVGVPRIRARKECASVAFVADDAIRLAGYGQIPESFDLIFVRHQNLWFNPALWQKIYDFALHRVAPGGLLVITSYFDREHLEALAVLRSLGGRVLTSCQNPWTRKLDYPGKTVDRHVAAIVAGDKVQDAVLAAPG